MTRPNDQHCASLDAVEARFAARLAASLNERTLMVPHDISERLRFSRELATSRMRQAHSHQARPGTVVVGASRNAAALTGGPGRFWLQLASWVPLAILVAGMVLIQLWNDREQVLAAAEIDAVLLADDLPPTAWTDPGFREYLKAPPP